MSPALIPTITPTSPTPDVETQAGWASGLAGTGLWVRIIDADENPVYGRVPDGITERIPNSGIYEIAPIPAPSGGWPLTTLTIVVDDGTSTRSVATIAVSASLPPSNLSYDLATEVGQVRFEIPDTDPDSPLLDDAEIQYALDSEPDVPAAARCCEVLARRFSAMVDVSLTSGGDTVRRTYSTTAKEFAARAAELRSRASGITTVRMIRTDLQPSPARPGARVL